MTATEKLRRLLDERGVEWSGCEDAFAHETYWKYREHGPYRASERVDISGELLVHHLTPEQAIAATLGQEPWVNPTWKRWHRSLRHDEIKSIGDAVEQLMYEAIESGGDMGPNGNTYNGIDEGDVLTSGFINEWIERFESALGSCNCSDNCTNGERTETCKLDDFADIPFSVDYEIEGYDIDSGRDYATLAECSACGAYIIVPPEYHHVLTCDGDEVYQPYRFCPVCGRRIEQ